MSLRNIFIFLVIGISLSVVYGLLRLFYFVGVSGDVVEYSRAYEQNPPGSPDIKILILGDSTAVGTGAKDPGNSVAGRLGRDFPRAKIVNRASNGLKSDELLHRLDEFLEEEYDLIVIHIGANDVLRLKQLGQTKENIRNIISRSLQHFRYVALFTSGNMGEAHLIPWFARPLMSHRSKDLRNFAVGLDLEMDNLAYVDLYFKGAPIPDEQFYAEDMLHLSDEGYGFWYSELKSALIKKTDLY